MGLFAKLRLYAEDPHQHAGGSRRGGEFWDYEKGISLGCPLSPLIGAFFLNALDQRMERFGLFYVRFMDDILVLAATRWRLRKAVKRVNEVLGRLHLKKHPEKTFIGRIEKGFDYLGYRFGPEGLSVAARTIERFVARAAPLKADCIKELGLQEGAGFALEDEAGELAAGERPGIDPDTVGLDFRARRDGVPVHDDPAVVRLRV